MINKFINFLFFIFVVLSVYYLALPNPDFPNPPSDAVQSSEPGDTETPLRRAYFTNYTRQEVINHYKKEYSNLPFLRFNYPPEDSQTIIRDQTRSTYLEEITHPFRESIYINGFEPDSQKDTITINGQNWRQKIIIKQVNSNVLSRLLIMTLTLVAGLALMREYKYDKRN